MSSEDFKDYLLGTLSFYEEMRLEQILIDLNMDKMQQAFSNLNLEELHKTLKSLEKEKKVKVIIRNSEKFWIRRLRNRSRINWDISFIKLVKTFFIGK